MNSLLCLNGTNSLTIPGIFYNYIISCSEDSTVSIEKRNIDSFYILDFDIKKQEIEYFDFRDDSNTHSIDDYNNGLFFIYEFYNLFIQRKFSTVLTNLYNFLSKKDTDYLYFSTTDKNIFFKIEKPGNHLILLLKIDRNGKIMNLKGGVYGPFFGCSDYPRCKGSLSINIVKKENS